MFNVLVFLIGLNIPWASPMGFFSRCDATAKQQPKKSAAREISEVYKVAGRV